MARALQDALAGGATQPANFAIEVSFGNDSWWQLPGEIADLIFITVRAGADLISFTYDWGYERENNYRLADGTLTMLSRYMLDFTTMQQRDLDTGRIRTFRVIHISVS